MSDLSNLLGDVYGDHSPDGPPVRREAAASERSPGWNAPAPQEPPAAPRFTVAEPVRPQVAIDDDLAAALSAALSDAAAPAPAPAYPQPAAPAPAPAPAAMPVVNAAPYPQAAAPPAPAPVPVPVPVAPVAAVPAPVAMAPAAVAQEARFWMRGDDDIFPRGSKGSKKKRK